MKLVLTPTQKKFTEDIPEIESLIRTYTVIDNILIKFKTENNTVDNLQTLLQDVREIVDDLCNNMLREIDHYKTTNTIQIVKKFKNPELNTTAFNIFIECYKDAKRVLDTYEITQIQQKLFRNIGNAVKLILRYRNGKYYIPKVTQQIINQIGW